MQAAQTRPTLEQFKRLSADIVPAARAVLVAQAFAELERERVTAYTRPVFDRYAFVYGELAGDDLKGKRIEHPKHLYLCGDDALVARYFEDCDTAHRAHGFTGPHGHCPALTAESVLMRAETEFLKLASPLFGVDFSETYGDARNKALKLLMGAAINAAEETGQPLTLEAAGFKVKR
jgi:hypothetical protein